MELTVYGNATIKSSTITRNLGDESAEGDRRAGVAFFGNLILENSIVAANQGGDFEFAPCVFPEFCRQGVQTPEWTVRHSLIGHNRHSPLVEAPLGHPDSNGNLIGGPVGGAVDPRLGPLSDNGGPTLTHALLPESPAIDAGDSLAVAGSGDVPQFDQRGAPISRIAAGRIDIGSFESQIAPVDFNHDHQLRCDDVDALVAAIVEGVNPPEFDLTADDTVDQADLELWLALAGLENLPTHRAYRYGDANLDGRVTARDLNIVGVNWRQDVNGWCRGDFVADGRVDAKDLNALAINWNNNILDQNVAPTVPRAPLAKRAFAEAASVSQRVPLLKRAAKVWTSAVEPEKVTVSSSHFARAHMRRNLRSSFLHRDPRADKSRPLDQEGLADLVLRRW